MYEIWLQLEKVEKEAGDITGTKRGKSEVISSVLWKSSSEWAWILGLFKAILMTLKGGMVLIRKQGTRHPDKL